MGLARMTEMSHPPQKPYLLRAKAWTFDKLDIRHSLGEDLLFELVLVPTFLPTAGPVVSACFFVWETVANRQIKWCQLGKCLGTVFAQLSSHPWAGRRYSVLSSDFEKPASSLSLLICDTIDKLFNLLRCLLPCMFLGDKVSIHIFMAMQGKWD